MGEIMSINQQLTAELKNLVGFAADQPTTVVLQGADQLEMEIDFIAVDSMSCAFRELRLRVPALANATLDSLKAWADALSVRVTYLLENIGPLEVDPDAGQVLMRSTPPDRQPDATSFYEIVLSTDANGNFALRRFASHKGQPGRTPVDLHTTHQVLQKLTKDLVETVPVA
jgi:hypothetical protein